MTIAPRAAFDVVIVGGGPGGYEAALVATQLGAKVAVVEETGMGGSAVLTDCVPSKALIAQGLGAGVDLPSVNQRILQLARDQSGDVHTRLAAVGIEQIAGRGELLAPNMVQVSDAAGNVRTLTSRFVLLAPGARARRFPGTDTDSQRVLTWDRLYTLPQLPEHLIVVGSGVTGAEFANAYAKLGCPVTLVSSRDHVLPGEDAAAAQVVQTAFAERQIRVLNRVRAQAITEQDDHVLVHLSNEEQVSGSHVLVAIGSIPNSHGLTLDHQVETNEAGFIQVDRVSRTTVPGVYAAGDVTGVNMLASVAAMQGRIAMRHALGASVRPFQPRDVSAAIFTDPQVATVGCSQQDVDSGGVAAVTVQLPLSTNARAKMSGITDGFVKLFADPRTRTIVGGVVVAPEASELIHSISLAVHGGLDAAALAQAYTVYPSLSGTISEAARQLES